MGRYISIKVILDNLLDHPMLQNITLERVISYTIRFMQLVGMPKLFIDRVATLEVNDYMANLPCDFIKPIQVRDNKTHEVFLSATDSFFKAHDNTNFPTYKIQGTVLHSSIKECTIDLSYEAIPVDEEGYPMLINNEAFLRALELFIKKSYFTILFDQGKLQSQVYNNIQQEYAFAVGQAQTSLIMPTLDEMQSIANMWNTLIPRMKDHSTAFKGSNIPEQYKTH